MGTLKYTYNGRNEAISATTPDGLVIEFSNRCISGYRGVTTSGIWANGDDRPFLAQIDVPMDRAIRSQMPIASRRSLNWTAHYGSYTDVREAAYMRALGNADPVYVDNWFAENYSRGDVDRYPFPAYVYELPLTTTVEQANAILATRRERRNARKDNNHNVVPAVKARRAGTRVVNYIASANAQVQVYASHMVARRGITGNVKGLVLKVVGDRQFATYNDGVKFVDGVIANATRAA